MDVPQRRIERRQEGNEESVEEGVDVYHPRELYVLYECFDNKTNLVMEDASTFWTSFCIAIAGVLLVGFSLSPVATSPISESSASTLAVDGDCGDQQIEEITYGKRASFLGCFGSDSKCKTTCATSE